MMSIEERARQRDLRAMVAPDTIDVIIERVRGLLRWGRRITIARRYLHSVDSVPEVTAGLVLDPEQADGGLDGWQRRDAKGITVWLRPGLLSGFGFSAYVTDDPEEALWSRYYSKTQRREDMTLVEIHGGLPGDWGPSRQDQMVITRWNTHGVAQQIVVAFDYGPGEQALAEADAALLDELARGDGSTETWDEQALIALAERLRYQQWTLAQEMRQRRGAAPQS